MSDTVAARVARGAAYLDEHHPGWEWCIDLSTLDMGRCDRCIVGQAVWSLLQDHRSADIFFAYDFAPTEDLSDLGFDTQPCSGLDLLYAQLEEAWTALIKERFSSGLLSDV